MPAKAGIQAGLWDWIPAFAGMTNEPLGILGQSRLCVRPWVSIP